MNMSKKRKPPKWMSNARWRSECRIDDKLRTRLWLFGSRWKRQFDNFTNGEGVHPDEFWALMMSYVDHRPLPGSRAAGGVKPIRPRFVSGEKAARQLRLGAIRRQRTKSQSPRNEAIRKAFDKLWDQGLSKGEIYKRITAKVGLSERQVRTIITKNPSGRGVARP